VSEVKHFTPQEATQTLPLVKKIVEDILKIGQRMRSISFENKEDGEAELTRLMDQLDELFDEMEELGCSYKDWNFSAGLVDFPSFIEGREVYLCWRSDEPEILYYHELDAGFNGRKAIPASSLSAKK
jgi:hypothetical protein